MNETDRLILENQKIIMKVLRFGYNLEINGILGDSLCRHIDVIEKALAPTSDEIGYEEDISEGAVSSEETKQ